MTNYEYYQDKLKKTYLKCSLVEELERERNLSLLIGAGVTSCIVGGWNDLLNEIAVLRYCSEHEDINPDSLRVYIEASCDGCFLPNETNPIEKGEYLRYDIKDIASFETEELNDTWREATFAHQVLLAMERLMERKLSDGAHQHKLISYEEDFINWCKNVSDPVFGIGRKLVSDIDNSREELKKYSNETIVQMLSSKYGVLIDLSTVEKAIQEAKEPYDQIKTLFGLLMDKNLEKEARTILSKAKATKGNLNKEIGELLRLVTAHALWRPSYCTLEALLRLCLKGRITEVISYNFDMVFDKLLANKRVREVLIEMEEKIQDERIQNITIEAENTLNQTISDAKTIKKKSIEDAEKVRQRKISTAKKNKEEAITIAINEKEKAVERAKKTVQKAIESAKGDEETINDAKETMRLALDYAEEKMKKDIQSADNKMKIVVIDAENTMRETVKQAEEKMHKAIKQAEEKEKNDIKAAEENKKKIIQLMDARNVCVYGISSLQPIEIGRENFTENPSGNTVRVYHVHGILDRDEGSIQPIIFSGTAYKSYQKSQFNCGNMYLANTYHKNNLLCVGFSGNDINFRRFIEQMMHLQGDSHHIYITRSLKEDSKPYRFNKFTPENDLETAYACVDTYIKMLRSYFRKEVGATILWSENYETMAASLAEL